MIALCAFVKIGNCVYTQCLMGSGCEELHTYNRIIHGNLLAYV